MFGEFQDLPIQEYHQKLPFPESIKDQWLSASSLKNYDPENHCPQDFANYMLQKSKGSTPSTIFGIVVHMILGEPKRYKEDVIYVNASTRAQKAFKTAILDHPNAIVLLESQRAAIEEAAFAVQNHERASQYFKKPAQFEVTFRFEHEGLKLQTRPDMIADDSSFVCDFKTACDVSPKAFSNASEKLGYFLSPPLTFLGVQKVRGIIPKSYVFIVVENTKKPKPNVNIFEVELSDPFFCYGDHLLSQCIEKHLECVKENHWPTYDISDFIMSQRQKKIISSDYILSVLD